MNEMFIAAYDDCPLLIRFEVLREDSQYLYPDHGAVDFLIGDSTAPSRVGKRSKTLFESRLAALEYLRKEAEEHVQICRKRLENAEENLRAVKEMYA